MNDLYLCSVVNTVKFASNYLAFLHTFSGEDGFFGSPPPRRDHFLSRAHGYSGSVFLVASLLPNTTASPKGDTSRLSGDEPSSDGMAK